ncbi:MAG: hypothetical protein A3C53_03580 [Omnitrophica WOR_2 bacterium RIFCSPHIGHO2_02_FULL_68_15]|nr:MAG: hypothetical protein A3C53_03580 [Omnitrophica WOR_2 bacterium RIFCSPHIGHO2_02_FULL_68_15]
MTPPAKRGTPPRAVEAEGATVQRALAKALQALGARRDQVTVKILAEEEGGLFGMKGTSPAKVRVTLKCTSTSDRTT